MRLDSILSRFSGVQEDGDGWVAICPTHADHAPSLRLAVSDKGAVLVKCRARCETRDVLAAVGLSFPDLFDVDSAGVERIATSTSTPASPADVAALAVRLDGYAAALWTTGIGALQYVDHRFGLSTDDAARLGLGFATDLGGGPRLVVPFRDARGVARGFQARALDPEAAVRWLGPKSPDGASWAKVGFFPSSTDWPKVVIAEGPGDALTAVAAGYDAVAIRGASLAGSVVEEVAGLVGDRLAVVAGDADASGESFSRTLAEALAAAGKEVRILVPPIGGDLTGWREAAPGTFAVALAEAIGEAEAIHPVAPREAILRWGAEFAESATDVAGARLLLESVQGKGSDVRFSPEAGFYLLDAGVWRPDRLDRIRTFAHGVADTLRSWLREAPVPEKGTDEAKAYGAVKRYAIHAQTTRGIDSMIRELQALPGVAVSLDDFDARPDLLAFRNGVVDLRTGELLPHDPAFLLTRRVDVDFDPTATAPRWEGFLGEIFPAYPDLPAYLRRLVGYGITGRTDEQCFAVFWGKGANGKTVLTDTLASVFAEIHTATPFSTFEQKPSGGIPNDLAALKGARLVSASEGEQGRPMAESVLKRVTGRDLISARFMRREFFEFRPTFLLLLATNYKPQFRGQDEGLWRRVKLVPFERYFRPEERDHRLADRLLAEAAGIAAWAVRGAVEWYASGLGDPRVVREATREYRETSDALSGFVGAGGLYEVTGEETDHVLAKVLWESYLTWADEENLPQRERWTRRTLFGALEERGLVKHKRNVGLIFQGVRPVRPGSDTPPPERAEPSPLADSSPATPTATGLSGPSLDVI